MPSKIVIIKPPGVEFKRKSTEGFLDYNDKNGMLTTNPNVSSDANFTKRGSGPGPNQPMGRNMSMSTKGIKWGNNQSIDVNTDKLLLTTTGKDPNIISYRKALNSNDTSNNNYGRLASAKVGGKPRGKLINSS